MNRIKLKYWSKTEKHDSKLQLFNDIKGYSCEQVGHTYTGSEADLMFKLLSNVDYSKLDDCMNYGIMIIKENGE